MCKVIDTIPPNPTSHTSFPDCMFVYVCWSGGKKSDKSNFTRQKFYHIHVWLVKNEWENIVSAVKNYITIYELSENFNSFLRNENKKVVTLPLSTSLLHTNQTQTLLNQKLQLTIIYHYPFPLIYFTPNLSANKKKMP